MPKPKREKVAWSSVIIAIVVLVLGARFAPDLLSNSEPVKVDRASGPGANKRASGAGAGERTEDVFDVLDEELSTTEETLGVHRFGRKMAPRKRDGYIRLATYNVENMFDGVDDPVSSAHDVEWEKPEAQLQAVAGAIRDLDADIIALQEVESESVLRAFRDEHLAGMGYDHIASLDAGDGRGIEQSVLSRFEITDARVWDNYDTGHVHPELWEGQPNHRAGERIVLRRSPLMATIEVPSSATGGAPYELTLLVVHHKSGRGNDYWREAESEAVIGLIKGFARGEGRNIAVLGDFNAMNREESIKIYADSGFRDCWQNRSRGDEASTHESGRAIDFILVNEALASEIVDDSAFVLGTIARPKGVDWRTYRPPPGYAADHYPTAVDLRPADR